MHLAGIQLYDAMQHFQFSCSVRFSCCHGNKAPFSHLCHQCTFHYGQGDQIASPAVYATFVCVSVCVRLFDWLHPSIIHLQLSPRLPQLCILYDIPITYSNLTRVQTRHGCISDLTHWHAVSRREAVEQSEPSLSREREGEMERRRGKLRSDAGLGCASTQKFRQAQGRTLAALRLTTVYCEDAGGRTKCINSSTWQQMVQLIK